MGTAERPTGSARKLRGNRSWVPLTGPALSGTDLSGLTVPCVSHVKGIDTETGGEEKNSRTN